MRNSRSRRCARLSRLRPGSDGPTLPPPATTRTANATSEAARERHRHLHRQGATNEGRSILVLDRTRSLRLLDEVSRALRPTRADGAVAGEPAPSNRRAETGKMPGRSEPALTQMLDVCDEKRQAATHRLANKERLREPKLARRRIEVEGHRPRDVHPKLEVVRLPQVVVTNALRQSQPPTNPDLTSPVTANVTAPRQGDAAAGADPRANDLNPDREHPHQ